MNIIKIFLKRKLFNNIDNFILSERKIFKKSIYIYSLLNINLDYIIYKILKKNNIVIDRISEEKQKKNTVIIKYVCKYKWEELVLFYNKNKKFISIYKLYNF